MFARDPSSHIVMSTSYMAVAMATATGLFENVAVVLELLRWGEWKVKVI